MAAATGTLDSLRAAIETRIGAKTPTAAFARVLLDTADPAIVDYMGEDALVSDIAEAFVLLSNRQPGLHRIRHRPAAAPRARSGQVSPATLIEIVNDDMPFLLDSVMGEIQARGLKVQSVLHPILTVVRDHGGLFLSLGAAHSANGAAAPARAESFIQIALDPISIEAADDLVASLSQILVQVRAAVTDWPAMLARVQEAADDLADMPGVRDGELGMESIAFLKWLTSGYFTFLGLRAFRLEGSGDARSLIPVADSGLGVLRDPSAEVLRRGTEGTILPAEATKLFFGPSPLIISKANMISMVHRRAHMDYIGVKTYARNCGGAPSPTGELRIVGLFTSQAYVQSPHEIPFLRHKAETVRHAFGFPPASHAGKALLNVLNTFPRDELFQIGGKQLEQWCAGILDLELRPRVRVFTRVDRFGRYASVLCYLPRDRYTTAVREKITAILSEVHGGRVVTFTPYFPEGPLVRVHFIVSRPTGAEGHIDDGMVEARVAQAVRTWDDTLADTGRSRGAETAANLTRFKGAFPPAYADTFTPARALFDLDHVAALSPAAPTGFAFVPDNGPPTDRVRAAVYRLGESVTLSERVPVLENMGFTVVEERSFVLGGDGPRIALHDMVLETQTHAPFDHAAMGPRTADTYLQVARGAIENDSFNALVLFAGLDWREAAILRAYAAYLRQIGTPFGPRYVAQVLASHAGITRDLVELFHTRFNPRKGAETRQRAEREIEIRARIDGALANVPSLDEDRILRLVLNLISATMRTTAFASPPAAVGDTTVAFKFASRSIEALPSPKPRAEIFVAGPRVEGVHLRFAPIARGGIRWSDRAQDFRTEVLGLVKAQLVKNAVIVPSGAKGGFLPKRLPRSGTRDEITAEAIAAYKLFIGALLDLTDNIVDGAIVPPAGIVRHDGDDPYLVVAADKGTATFSDIANGLATSRNFWLGDAFASGGSAGYDHKKMGITARGAWECVKRHFREMDRDIQTSPVTVVGVGDMSGDVFGNGMLLSPEIRLVAAFDHRDIFIDPEPDPATSFAERRRLFDLPRSSWQDYARAAISAGGGVFPRAAKAIVLTAEMRRVLGLDQASATPAEVMRAILKANVDLLWFGGIGTYVRAETETDEQAGDRANDALRITAGEIGAAVIGEGANLGLTQRARVAFAARGGRLNTDFIDNSAGVNSSDQEVNIKIALGPAVRAKRLDDGARRTFLASMTDDVARACLANNYRQSQALSLAEHTSARDTGPLSRLMGDLEKRGLLDRTLEALPGDRALLARVAEGKPLTRPELAVLLSFAKIALTDDLLAGRLPDAPFTADFLTQYFPPRLIQEFSKDVAGHRLRREIIATEVTNRVVNRGGISLVRRIADETGRTTEDAATGFLAAERVLGLDALWSAVDALDGCVPGMAQIELHRLLQDRYAATTQWMVRDGGVLANFDAATAEFLEGVKALGATPPKGTRTQQWIAVGVPQDLARRIDRLDQDAAAPEIVRIGQLAKAPLARVMNTHLTIAEHLRLTDIETKLGSLAIRDEYERLAMAKVVGDLERARRQLTIAVLADGGGAPGVDGSRLLAPRGPRAARTAQTLQALASADTITLPRLVVAVSAIEDLAAPRPKA
jgi:glutamate dehydrogenase